MRLGWVHFTCRFGRRGWVRFARRLPNPEIALFIEDRAQSSGKAPVWQFTVGRMSHSELHLEYDGKEVFSGPRGGPLSGPDKPYWVTSIDAPPFTEPKK
jgi:hypothetical protein